MSPITGYIKRGETRVFYFFNHTLSCRYLDGLMRTITHLGSTTFSIIFPLSLIFLIPSYFVKMIGLHLSLTLGISQLLAQVLKRIVNRPRPYRVMEDVIARRPPSCQYSFPSGHTCAAFAMALVLTVIFPSWGFLFVGLAGLVGISRIYLGYHYPTDVLVGFLIALVCWGFDAYLIYTFPFTN